MEGLEPEAEAAEGVSLTPFLGHKVVVRQSCPDSEWSKLSPLYWGLLPDTPACDSQLTVCSLPLAFLTPISVSKEEFMASLVKTFLTWEEAILHI